MSAIVHRYRLFRLALHLAEGVATAFLAFPFLPARGREWLIRAWSRRLLRILGVRLVVEGALPEGGNVMVVSNHVSWVDIFLLLAIRPLRFVSKADVRGWPVVGWLVAQAGTLFLERGKRSDAARVNRHIGDVLAAGGRVAFFPEGTTTDGGEVRHFHASLLEPAVLAHATVQPVALRYRRTDGRPSRAPAYDGDITLMQTLEAMAAERAVVAEVRFLPPLTSAGHGRRELAQQAERAIRASLDLAAPHRAPGTPADPPV